MKLAAPLLVACLGMIFVSTAIAGDEREATIESLGDRVVAVQPGDHVAGGAELARDHYRRFLDLVTDDPELRAEALRRLGDLELEAHEDGQLRDVAVAADAAGVDKAVGLYRRLLEAYPDFRRNDSVLYQLARAYEAGGMPDEALSVLDELVSRFPDTALLDEVQFRRGEMLFLKKHYKDAEQAYSAVVLAGAESRFFEQSLYKLGWSRFKLAWHEDSLEPFFALLDRKLEGADSGESERRLADLSRAERELVDDTFRVLSINFSYMNGAASIGALFARRGSPPYGYVIYQNLGDLFLEKQRYVDAAESYEAFVAIDALHPQAPLLHARAIDAYRQGEFPTLALDGKKRFVERYGMDSEFWQRNALEDNLAVAGLLRANLTDLAAFYHAEAQRDGNKADFRQAADWYRRYLAYFPDDADSANTNFLLAELLFESEDFGRATLEYEKTAYAYGFHARSAEAGYAAILAYREQEALLHGPERDAWHRDYIDSGIRFAETYPEHPQSGAVLTTIAEDLFAQGQFARAIDIGRTVVGKQPPVAAQLIRTAWTVIAHSHFDLADYSAAESAYYSLRNLLPADDGAADEQVRERIASSIYKQGEQARDAGDLETAVGHFLRLGGVVPASPIRQTAEYDAAAALISLQAWNRASVVLEQFRNNYPQSEFTGDVTRKLAVIYLESGDTSKAAVEFERIARASSEDGERREALWKAASLYEERGDSAGEQRVLAAFVNNFPWPVAESIEARQRLLDIATERGEQGRRTQLLQDIVRADAAAGAERSDRTRSLAAQASLELAEPARQRYSDARLRQPLAASLKVKKALMEEVIALYTGVAGYGVAEVTTAATFRLAEVYEDFGAELMNSERPRDLDQDALEQYEILLEEQAFPFEEKAIELYQANAARAAAGIYDEWVRKSYVRLAALVPARYAKEERSEDVVTTLL